MAAVVEPKVPCFVTGGGCRVLQRTERFEGSQLCTPLPGSRRVHIAVARVEDPSLDSMCNVAEEAKPAFSDSQRFREGASVARWRHLRTPSSIIEVLPLVNAIAGGAPLRNGRLLPLWVASLGRASTFCALNTLSSASLRVIAQNDYKLLEAFVGHTFKSLYVRYYEVYVALSDDIARVRDNIHKQPWDMTFQSSASGAMRFLHRAANIAKEVDSMVSAMRKGSTPDVWLHGEPYPEYYRYSYHYQADGWLSSRSAEAYELLTETLLFGTQDAMQRVTFHALTPYLRAQARQVAAGRNPVVVEVGAGTGRFATFVRDNFRNIDLHLSDLSPFYLQSARENMVNWEVTVKPDKTRMGRTFYVQANAERLPFTNASVDVLYSMYLMHELPPQTRRAVVAEAARVLRKGGLFIITDSTQLGDIPRYDKDAGKFSNLNEPWYTSYLTEDFGHLVTKDGAFIADRKEICTITKMLSFIRT